MFKNFFKNKKVLITGNTGFKGSWLTTWLLQLNANVVGYSNSILTNPSLFQQLGLENSIKQYFKDIRNRTELMDVLKKERPEIIFHLAAQAIVSESYINPLETISSNVMGTSNLLDVLKDLNYDCTCILITSDKAYENVEQLWGYNEESRLGGKDIYSSSKSAADIIIRSFFYSFFKNSNSKTKIAVGRAGNVIGGGDWSVNRIVVDAVKAWSKNKPVIIRAPNATRPWQHVLEPCGGYLSLAYKLSLNDKLNGQAFNFGPKPDQDETVLNLLLNLSNIWGLKRKDDIYSIADEIPFKEAGLLKLNCEKAYQILSWSAVLSYDETVRYTGEWYLENIRNSKNLLEFSIEQIRKYMEQAEKQKLIWIK